MSRANEIRKIAEQAAEEVSAFNKEDLKSVLNEFDYGLSVELSHNTGNISTGLDATTVFELASDQGVNWIEFQLWDKNRFDSAIGSVRYICKMRDNGDTFTVFSGRGIENLTFSSKNDEIESIPDIKDKKDYKDKIQRIRRIFLGFQLNVTGIVGIPNDPNSFENIGRKVGKDLIKKCQPLK